MSYGDDVSSLERVRRTSRRSAVAALDEIMNPTDDGGESDIELSSAVSGLAEDRIDTVGSPFNLLDHGAWEALREVLHAAVTRDAGQTIFIHLSPDLLSDEWGLPPFELRWNCDCGGRKHERPAHYVPGLKWRIYLKCPLCGMTFNTMRIGHTSSSNCTKNSHPLIPGRVRYLIQDRLSAYFEWGHRAVSLLPVTHHVFEQIRARDDEKQIDLQVDYNIYHPPESPQDDLTSRDFQSKGAAPPSPPPQPLFPFCLPLLI